MYTEIERRDAITWVRVQMARHGLHLQDLIAAGCIPVLGAATGDSQFLIRYRNAEGQTWDGQGAMPEWLQRALNAGQGLDHFAVDYVR